MAEHVRGTMDIRKHEKTFEGFVRMVAWGAVAILCLLVFIALVNG